MAQGPIDLCHLFQGLMTKVQEPQEEPSKATKVLDLHFLMALVLEVRV